MDAIRNKKIVALAILLFVCGGGVGYGAATFAYHNSLTTLVAALGPVRLKESTSPLIHPLIAFETPETTALPNFVTLKEKIENVVAQKTKGGNVSSVSVYFRDLETSRWIGINDRATYFPASLLKVPLLIAYFKAKESDPGLFRRSITYTPIHTGEKYEAPSTLKKGHAYTIKQLLEHMVIDSDNGATYTLLARLDTNFLNGIYTQLGIQDPGDDSSNYQVEARTYALFFRTLFNATFLSPADSAEALEMLTQATYSDGLAAGVPPHTTIAHKFGQHVLRDTTGPTGIELHDCGIVYRPTQPYLLCVMTRAKNIEVATDIIRSISKEVYTVTAKELAE